MEARMRTRLSWAGAAPVLLLVVLGVKGASPATAERSEKGRMQLTSTAFTEGGSIPAKYTCDGTNVSPPLRWTGTPAQAKSVVLIVDDPDAPAGTWVHWVLYDVPATVNELPEGVAKSQSIPQGGREGLNDFRRVGYGGPCPPGGRPHRYFFRLYALDTVLDLKPGATRKEVDRAMERHVVAQGQLMGTYQRK